MKNVVNYIFTLVLICFINSSLAQTTLKVVGSSTFNNALMVPNKANLEGKTGLKIENVGNGSGRGIELLISGEANVAMISSDLSAVAAKLNAAKPGTVKETDLKAELITEVVVEIVVHPSNTVKTITNEQLVNLLAGTIKNWKEIGGPDLAVVVVTANPGDGIRTTIESEVLKKTPFTTSARQLGVASQVSKVVGQIPGAIGGVSKKDVTASVAVIKSGAPIKAPLFLVTKGSPSPDVQKLIAALKGL